MHCLKRVAEDLLWVGANDRRLALFEGVYSVPRGVAYNSYLILDEKTAVVDCVDRAVGERFLENVAAGLNGRRLDYLIVQHVEPDHSGTIKNLLAEYPEAVLVCSTQIKKFINQFYEIDLENRVHIVAEGNVLSLGRRKLTFVMAPMVHWPEVMVTFDMTDGILFSADAFGCFGAADGAIFADEVDFERDYMDEARRYYANIVGKYGGQVQGLLKKASGLEINMICPLHGFVWRKNLRNIITKYQLWSAYEPEERGVLIAYASIYGNTENAAEILSSRLRERGIKTVMYDLSVVPVSEAVAAAFRWSHMVLASATYNAGIFTAMNSFIYELLAHNIQNRTVALIENGSWASSAGRLMREKMEQCRNMRIVGETISIRSGVKDAELPKIDALADALAATFPPRDLVDLSAPPAGADSGALHKISYGTFVLTAKDGGKHNGCVINTAIQVSSVPPLKISVTVNKGALTHDIIAKTKEFNVSVLAESAPFDIYRRFGYNSGRDTDKFDGLSDVGTTENGIKFLKKHVNSVISAKVCEMTDCGSHTIFVAEITQAFAVNNEPSATYRYYYDNVRPIPKAAPKPKPEAAGTNRFVCKVCGYIYEGDTLPDDFICPLCKHGAADFEKME